MRAPTVYMICRVSEKRKTSRSLGLERKNRVINLVNQAKMKMQKTARFGNNEKKQKDKLFKYPYDKK